MNIEDGMYIHTIWCAYHEDLCLLTTLYRSKEGVWSMNGRIKEGAATLREWQADLTGPLDEEAMSAVLYMVQGWRDMGFEVHVTDVRSDSVLEVARIIAAQPWAVVHTTADNSHGLN